MQALCVATRDEIRRADINGSLMQGLYTCVTDLYYKYYKTAGCSAGLLLDVTATNENCGRDQD